MQEIRAEYTGSASRSPVEISLDAAHMRVILITYDEANNSREKILFTGDQFSEEEFARRVAERATK